jgi:hypothetical protein
LPFLQSIPSPFLVYPHPFCCHFPFFHFQSISFLSRSFFSLSKYLAFLFLAYLNFSPIFNCYPHLSTPLSIALHFPLPISYFLFLSLPFFFLSSSFLIPSPSSPIYFVLLSSSVPFLT